MEPEETMEIPDTPEGIELDLGDKLNEDGTVNLSVTLLEIWLNIMEGAGKEAENTKLDMRTAFAIQQNWPSLKLNEIPGYQSRFYDHLAHLKLMLGIEEESARLQHVEDDAEFNRDKYLEIVVKWMNYIDEQEAQWDLMDEQAMMNAAALMDAARFVLGGPGSLGGMLDQIGIDLDSDEITAENLRQKEE